MFIPLICLLLIVSTTIYFIIALTVTTSAFHEDEFYGDTLGDHCVYYREDWNGESVRNRIYFKYPSKNVIISHSMTDGCDSLAKCSKRVRQIQEDHMNLHSWNDIGYNFLIGGDGSIYVGRGWDVKSFHPIDSIGINFIGNFRFDTLNDTMIDAALLLLDQGYALGSKRESIFSHSKIYLKDLFRKTRTKIYICVFILVIIIIITVSLVVGMVYIHQAPTEEKLGEHPVYSKEDWGGQPPISEIFFKNTPNLVIISHSASTTCSSFQTCSEMVRKFQKEFINNLWSDIGYNFLIGGDGAVYVGRGWGCKSWHPKDSIGINFIGDYQFDILNSSMIDVAILLLQQGLDKGTLADDYILVGENQTTKRKPTSPGENVVKVIKEWRHYSPVIL